MWLSKQMRSAPPTADADLGVTTIAGDSVGVVTRGEVRALPVYGPGGYLWQPENGGAGHQGRTGRRGTVRGRDAAENGSGGNASRGGLSVWAGRQFHLFEERRYGGYPRDSGGQRKGI